MDFEQQREQLKGRLLEYVRSITNESKGGFYVCPICGSGKGPHETGAFKVYEETDSWFCHACKRGGDLFDLIGHVENIPEHYKQLQRAQELFNGAPPLQPKLMKAPKKEEPEKDYTEFFNEAHKHINETAYHRGLSAGTLSAFNVGFVEYWKSESKRDDKTILASPRLIIPTSKSSYIARDTRLNSKSKIKQGSVHMLNAINPNVPLEEAVRNADRPIYIVEGEIDAMSIYEAGGLAIALGSDENKALFPLVEQARPKQPLIIALDNDEEKANGSRPGQEAAEKLAGQLQERGIPFYRFNPYGNSKDANEALCNDRSKLIEEIRQGEREAMTNAEVEKISTLVENAEEAEQAETVEKQAEPTEEKKKTWNDLTEEEKAARRETYNSKHKNIYDAVCEYWDTVYRRENETPAIPTGFSILDGPEALDGGLYPGLYIIGAMPSAGKTTFVEQIADYIAAAGNDVLFFSLEMTTFELIARSISRKTYEIAKMNVDNGSRGKAYLKKAVKTREIMKFSTLKDSTANDRFKLIDTATADYRDSSANHLYIIEAQGQIGVEEIRDRIREHYSFTGRRAVIVIDYIQLLKPADVRATDKQNMDFNMLALKQISRDFRAPLIGISSYNREGYSGKARMQSARDSSSIEYSCDVMLGIHYKGAGKKDFDIDEAKNKSPREIILTVLKNRNGVTGTQIKFDYMAGYNYFKDVALYKEKKSDMEDENNGEEWGEWQR